MVLVFCNKISKLCPNFSIQNSASRIDVLEREKVLVSIKAVVLNET